MVAADHFVQASGAICADHGVTGDQYNVLRILRGAHPSGHARSEIARRLVRRSPDVTRLLDRLERVGFVRRERGPEDSRQSVARITKKGLVLLETLDPQIDRLMEAIAKPLKDGDLRTLARLCSALVSSQQEYLL